MLGNPFPRSWLLCCGAVLYTPPSRVSRCGLRSLPSQDGLFMPPWEDAVAAIPDGARRHVGCRRAYRVMTSRNPRVWKAWSGLFRTREADRQYRE